jgi:hypothetical protein
MGEEPTWLQKFEPAGINCEFGFVLRKLGSERPTLFRWNNVRPVEFRLLLDNKFHDVFSFENVIPLGAKMVLDTAYKWAFHSALHSDENNQFLAQGAELKRLHRIEHAKIQHDINVFTQRLHEGGLVCVLLVKSMAEEDMAQTLSAIDRYAGNTKNSLLLVTEPLAASDKPGSVIEVASRLRRGVVSRVAPHGQADDADYDNWRLILETFGTSAEPANVEAS